MRYAVRLVVLLLLVSVACGAAARPIHCFAGNLAESWPRQEELSRQTTIPGQCGSWLPSDPWGARPHPKLARPWPRPPIRAVVAFLIRMRLPARVVSGTDGKESQSGDLAASPPRGWTTMEIATPIMVGFFVAAIAATVFVYYRHRLRHPPSIHRPAPVTVSCWDRFRLRMPGWVFGVLPGTHAVRPGNTHKPSTWSIDDADNIPLHAPQASSSTSSSGSGPGSGSGSLSRSGFASVPQFEPGGGPPDEFHPQFDDDDAEAEPAHRAVYGAPLHAHERNYSSASLLPHVDISFPRAAAVFGRFTDGARIGKSPGYRAGPVLQCVPHDGFKIDGVDSPTRPHAEYAREAQPPGTPPRGTDERSVLLISRVPGQDFVIEESEIGA